MIDWVGGYGSRNLPYGVDGAGHVVVAYHQNVIDLSQLTHLDVGPECWTSGSLNAFMELGPDAWRRTQMQIQKHLADLPGSALRPMDEVQLVLPWEVADYVDFYACEEHAASMGRLLRPDADPLPPAWKYLPIGYHGRSATVLVSGDSIGRPSEFVRPAPVPPMGPPRGSTSKWNWDSWWALATSVNVQFRQQRRKIMSSVPYSSMTGAPETYSPSNIIPSARFWESRLQPLSLLGSCLLAR